MVPLMRSALNAISLIFIVANSLAAQEVEQCQLAQPQSGDIGIRGLRCVGPSASCAIGLTDRADALRHEFAVEPVVVQIAPGGETGREREGVRVGDVLVAIDSLLITTRAGGARLANLPVGRPVRLLVRRDGRLVELTLTPVRGCGVRSITVRTGRSR